MRLDEKQFVLDTYAILALVEDEPGAQTVVEIVTGQESKAYLSIISLGEAYYILLRRKGERAAKEVTESIMMEEAIELVEVPWSRIKAAARIKAKGGLSYADSFVLELAEELQAPIVTGDPEIQTIAKELDVEIVWIADQKKN